MRGGFTGVEEARERAQVFSHHGRALSIYTPTLKEGGVRKEMGKSEQEAGRVAEDNDSTPFPSETSGANGLSDLVQPVTEWFHNSLK